MKRNTAIDLMKGLGMLLVVVDHSMEIPFEIRRINMSFLMPMFFMVAGYLYKCKSSDKGLLRDLAADIWKSFLRLWTPYILIVGPFLAYYTWQGWHTPHEAFWRFVDCAGVNDYGCRLHNHAIGVGCLWFLPAMFWCRFFFNTLYHLLELRPLSRHHALVRESILLLCSILGLMVLRHWVHIPLGISEGMSTMLYMLFGHWLKMLHTAFNERFSAGEESTTFILARHSFSLSRRAVLFVLMGAWAVLLAAWITAWFITPYIVVSGAFYPHIWLNIPGAVGFTVLYYFFCTQLCKVPGVSHYLLWIGAASLTFLCIHALDAWVQPVFFPGAIYPDWVLRIPSWSYYILRISTYSLILIIWQGLKHLPTLFKRKA